MWPIDTEEESSQHCYLFDRVGGDISRCNLAFRDINQAFMDNRVTFRITSTFPLVVDYKKEGNINTWTKMVFYYSLNC